jgi:hypothetical protein
MSHPIDNFNITTIVALFGLGPMMNTNFHRMNIFFYSYSDWISKCYYLIRLYVMNDTNQLLD